MHTAHSIHVLMKTCVLPLKAYTFTEKTHQTRKVEHPWKDWPSDMLRLMLSCWNIFIPASYLGICIWNSFKTASEDGPALQTVPVRTSVKPWIFPACKDWTINATASFLRLTQITIFRRPPPKEKQCFKSAGCNFRTKTTHLPKVGWMVLFVQWMIALCFHLRWVVTSCNGLESGKKQTKGV